MLLLKILHCSFGLVFRRLSSFLPTFVWLSSLNYEFCQHNFCGYDILLLSMTLQVRFPTLVATFQWGQNAKAFVYWALEAHFCPILLFQFFFFWHVWHMWFSTWGLINNALALFSCGMAFRLQEQVIQSVCRFVCDAQAFLQDLRNSLFSPGETDFRGCGESESSFCSLAMLHFFFLDVFFIVSNLLYPLFAVTLI